MANHNKNKRFGGGNFQRIRQSRPVGQEALEREAMRRQERQHASRLELEAGDDFFSTYDFDCDD
jgi:hypothetical protein